MSIGDKMREIEERAKNAAADGKRAIKDGWAETKASAEKGKNAVESEVDKM